MSTITAAKLLKYGSVCFIPATSFDTVSQSMSYAGQTILLLEQSDELPGFLGWFTIPGMADPNLAATDPGLDTTEAVSMEVAPPKKKNGKKAKAEPVVAQADAGEVKSDVEAGK